MRYIYLHGFASGPQSRKAQAFRIAFSHYCIPLEIPDLADGDFEHLTIGSQLKLLENLLQNEPVRAVGSSMGGYLAALYASLHPEMDRLVLLAPAFQFSSLWERASMTAPQLDEWRRTGWLSVFHYGQKIIRPVHYGLFEESALHPPEPGFSQPGRIFHGLHDRVVPIRISRDIPAIIRNVSSQSSIPITIWSMFWTRSPPPRCPSCLTDYRFGWRPVSAPVHERNEMHFTVRGQHAIPKFVSGRRADRGPGIGSGSARFLRYMDS